jgi:hypothetical protein
MRRFLLLLPLLLVRTFAASPADFLPPAPPWHGASEALVVRPDHPWITPSEKTGLTDTPGYDETIAWLRKLCAATPLVTMSEFGRTPEGRPLYAVVARKGTADKPVLLAQAGIHSGEIDGKDAGLMLLRDLAFGGKDGLLDRATLVFVPVFSADAHERSSEWNRPNQRGPVHQGWRTTARNLNLNRDYMKVDAPEMRALLGLLNQWQPALYLDLHVTDGIDYQYDITYGFHGWDGGFAWSPTIGAWLDRQWRPAMDAALTAAGHIPGPLIQAENNRDPLAGISSSLGDPRFSNAYGDLRHIPSVLVENHSLKPYRQRVLGTYVLLEASLKVIGDQAAAVRTAIATDAAARPATLGLNWSGPADAQTTMTFAGIAFTEYVSPASGIKEIRWLGTPKTYEKVPVMIRTKPGVEISRPRAYWVPPTYPEVIDRLKAHGVRMETLTAPTRKSVTHYRLVNPQTATVSFEGHFAVTTGVKPELRETTFPAGSVRVPTDQPLGNLAIALLEPQSTDSFLGWGFFPELLQRTEYIEGYVIAPLAEKMLADDPQLRAEFAAKLAAEPKFAADPTARLQWFYERTKFYDERYRLYPVGVER